MVKKNTVLFAALFFLLLQGCVSDDIIDAKPGEALPPVENLQYNIQGSAVELTWELPQAIPADIVLPVSVQVRVTADGQNSGTFVLENAPESFVHQGYDPAKSYRFTVKMVGDVDTTEPHISNIRYSLGTTVSF